MDACMCRTTKKWKIVSTLGFPFRTKPELALQYSNHYKTTKVCSHLISNSQQHCPCQPWAECSLPRRIRGVQVEAAEEVSLLREGLTGFQTTSTGSLRSANWDPGRLSWHGLIILKQFYSGDKIKAGRAQQNLKEVLTRSSFGIL